MLCALPEILPVSTLPSSLLPCSRQNSGILSGRITSCFSWYSSNMLTWTVRIEHSGMWHEQWEILLHVMCELCEPWHSLPGWLGVKCQVTDWIPSAGWRCTFDGFSCGDPIPSQLGGKCKLVSMMMQVCVCASVSCTSVCAFESLLSEYT